MSYLSFALSVASVSYLSSFLIIRWSHHTLADPSHIQSWKGKSVQWLSIGLNDIGVESRQGQKSRPAVGPIKWVFFLEVKQPRREADHSASGSEVKNPAISPSFLPILYPTYHFGWGGFVFAWRAVVELNGGIRIGVWFISIQYL